MLDSKDASRDGQGVSLWRIRLQGHTIKVTHAPGGMYTIALFEGEGGGHDHAIGFDYKGTKRDAAQHVKHVKWDLEKGAQSEPFAIITRAIHERGIRQRLALAALDKRGLWLTPEQMKQAGIYNTRLMA